MRSVALMFSANRAIVSRSWIRCTPAVVEDRLAARCATSVRSHRFGSVSGIPRCVRRSSIPGELVGERDVGANSERDSRGGHRAVAGDHGVAEDMSVRSGDPGVVQCGAESDETSAVLDVHTRRAGCVDTEGEGSVVRVNDPGLCVTPGRRACSGKGDGLRI